MFIIRIIRYLTGCVTFEAVGGFPERFINLCTKSGIPLWDLRHMRGCVVGTTTIRGYKAIRDCVRRSGVRVHIKKKSGFPFITYRQKKRAGLVIGLAAAGILVVFLSTMVWTVSVEGNSTVSQEQIMTVFSELGVKMGARRKALDVKAIADEAVRRFDGALSWAAVNIDGSHAVIEVRESIPVPEIVDTSTPCNIVAAEDGVITKIQLYAGQEEIKIGSAVLKGDLLISGIKVNLDKTETLKHADGNVFAQIEKNIEGRCGDVFSCESTAKIRYTLYFFGLKLPFGTSVGDENYYRVESYMQSGKTALPVGIIRERTCAYTQATAPESAEHRRLIAAKRFCDEYRAMRQTCTVLSGDFSYADECYSGTYQCEKQIGLKQEIFVEKN